MAEPIFLELELVLQLHDRQVAKWGGSAGVRDVGLLLSAIAQPMQTFGGVYVHEDLAAMAAAYLYHIVKNHPFVDGNKRAGAYAALLFLDLNSVRLQVDQAALGDLVLKVAEGSGTKDQVAEFFRTHMLPG